MNYFLRTESPFSRVNKLQSNSQHLIAVILIVLSVVFVGYGIYETIDISQWYDWKIFADAARTRYPYSVQGFYNPPIGLPILLPFAILPYQLGGTLWSMFCLFLTFVCVIRLSKGSNTILRLVLSFTSIPVIAYIDQGQICVLSLVSVTILETVPKSYFRAFGAVLGLFKPQLTGMATIVFWKDATMREKIVFISAFIASFIIYGFWISGMILNISSMNQSEIPNNLAAVYWPYSIVIGIVMLAYGYKKNSYFWSALSTPLFMPYFNAYSLFPMLAYVYAKINKNYAICLYLLVQIFFLIKFI